MTTYFFVVFPKWQDFQNLYRQRLIEFSSRHVCDDNNEQPCSGLDYWGFMEIFSGFAPLRGVGWAEIGLRCFIMEPCHSHAKM